VKGRIIIAALLAAVGLAVALPLAIGASGERSRALFAYMNGKKEVDSEGKKNTGDLNSLGTFSAVVNAGKLCYGLTIRGVDTPVAAHIHRGNSKVAGPVVIPLTQPATGDAGAMGECVDVDDKLLSELLTRPSRFYVNLHTSRFPNGSTRGQLKVQRR
jgi:CHRD domain